MGRGVRYGSLRFSERDGRMERGRRAKGRPAFTSAVRILRYGRGNLRRVHVPRVYAKARARMRPHRRISALLWLHFRLFVVREGTWQLAVDDRGTTPR